MSYATPIGGLPDQNQREYAPARFTTAYAVLPRRTMRDIVTSYLPFWNKMRAWILARPLSGFAETFSHLIVELESGGGTDKPELDPRAEAVLFVTSGALQLQLAGDIHALVTGSYVYIPAGCSWTIHNSEIEPATFHWLRKAYEVVSGIAAPEPFVSSDQETKRIVMPDCDGVWATSRFVDPSDMRHDMHVNIVTFQPDGVIPFAETHVMEHGIYVLQGRAEYLLNEDWVSVEAGDYMWLRAFCPQACRALEGEEFRYLLYKDVNRHPKLGGAYA